jgi:hypothetical protein
VQAAYPTFGAAAAYRPPSAGTAETLILVAFIFQVIITAIYLIFAVFLSLLAAAFIAAGVFGFGLGLPLTVGFAIFGVVMLYVGWELSYQRVRRGDYEGARTATLILGILGLLFGGILVGILYIIGYVKLGDAVEEARRPVGYSGFAPTPYAAPSTGYAFPAPAYGGGAPYALAPVPVPAAPPAASAAICPRCSRPATWIPQYGRSYCYSCGIYT